LALVNTLLLVASSLTVHVAHHGLLKDKRQTFLAWLAVTIGLGAIFLGVTVFEWQLLLGKYDPTQNLYLSAFFAITGLHGLHVIVGLVMLAVALVRGWRGHFTPKLHNGLEVPVVYWHLVDVVWLFVLLLLYVVPIFYQGPEVVLDINRWLIH
ncbi:MAG: heme-copper oxidase subunit III, partial [Truepera sp.]|nr:heme-copper oxidase subunit III [Truepera sp.]